MPGLLALCVSGCELVFGLGDYETLPGGAGGQATGGGGAAPGGAAAGGAGGVQDGCSCDLPPIWTPANLALRQPGDAPPPGECDDGSLPTSLFVGAPTVECSSCTCAPSGCALPDLLCYHQGSCQGDPDTTNPGPCSSLPGGSCASFELVAELGEASCTTEGGEPVQADPPFDELLAFCPDGRCGEGCVSDAAQCVVADGLPAAQCPEGFDYRYALAKGGQPACPACSCTATCEGPAYSAGLFDCGEVDIATLGCVSPGYLMVQAQAVATPACTATPAMTFPGSYEIGEQQTVCCRAAVAGLVAE